MPPRLSEAAVAALAAARGPFADECLCDRISACIRRTLGEGWTFEVESLVDDIAAVTVDDVPVWFIQAYTPENDVLAMRFVCPNCSSSNPFLSPPNRTDSLEVFVNIIGLGERLGWSYWHDCGEEASDA